jgi:hypothetical protein
LFSLPTFEQLQEPNYIEDRKQVLAWRILLDVAIRNLQQGVSACRGKPFTTQITKSTEETN